jgi:hypothetical protein
MDGLPRNRLARVSNDTATQSLTVPDTARVQWMRSGSLPQSLTVVFAVLPEGEDEWTRLGTGTRINGGWELTGLSLPSQGVVRARARTTGGQFNGSADFVEETKPIEFLPEIVVVEEPGGNNLTSGSSTVAFGPALLDAAVSRKFTVRNTGVFNLTGLEITFDGDHAPDFAVTVAPAAPVPPGDSTPFTVEFKSGIFGDKNAVLHLASNDRDEPSFDINLTATALVPDADHDGDGMTNASEVLLAGSGFDPLTDSGALIAELRASGVYLASDIHALALTQPVLERKRTGNFHLSVGVEKSPDFSSWTPLPELLKFVIEPEGAGPLFYRVFGVKPPL